MRYAPVLRAVTLAVGAAIGCTNAGGDLITGISTTGEVTGFVAVDANGSRVFDQGDDSLPGVRVRLVLRNGPDSGLTETTLPNGSYRFENVPVGAYSLRLDTASFSDTLQVVKVDSAFFAVIPGDTARINALAGLPLVTVRQARALPAGRRVFVVGVALNGAFAFADSIVHLADTSGTIRLVGVRGSFAAGDSLRVRATAGRRQGQPTLGDPTVFGLGQGVGPAAVTLTTLAAAGAGGGTRDAELVQVRGATISDTARTATGFVLTVSDSSGPLEVQLDGTAAGSFQSGSLPGVFVPGNKFDVLGVLAPTGTGAWRLRPRSAADVIQIPLPILSIAAVRALPAGRGVVVVGVALNSSGTFADSTVHVADTSGVIRLTRLRSTVTAGDSVRVQATTASRSGQPTLDGGTTTSLGRGFLPTAATLTTLGAGTAVGGTRDAQLVQVRGAIISDTARTATSFVLTVNDSSGPLEIHLDRTADQAFQPGSLPGGFVTGNKFDVLGVLTPSGTGTWQLKPRSAADLTQIPLPVLSIAAVRALPAGRIVVVVGVALNASDTFADSTVHVADTSGVIRLTRLRSTVAAGDSVRVQATTASRNGQPTLDGGTTTSLGRGFFPTAATLTTLAAGTAAGGTRDAELVRVRGAIISDTARTATSFVLTVSDSSGPLEIHLDRAADQAFQPGSLPGVFVTGNKFDVLGVLTPSGTGTWQLKPRSAADLTQIPLPVLSIAAVRALPAGRIVVVVGVALNGSGSFADSTVHLADTSGVIRLTRLRSTVAAGDSVRVQATTASRNGQPTLDGGTTASLGRGFFPTAATLTTLAAGAADAGSRDAQMVQVRGAIISDTARTATSFVLTVSDSSGALEVQLDRTADQAFQPGSLPGAFVPGNKFDMLGVLAPTATGTWRLKPRSAADLTPIPLPVLSIAAVRALPPGRRVVVVGVALNGSQAYADTTVHLADSSGSIRLTRLRATVSAGDSVRVQATTASRNGQPTLDAGTSTALGQGLFPTAPTLTTLIAATAAAGTRDGHLIVIDSATISDTTRVLGNFRLTVSDGSGDLIVQLDQTGGFPIPGVFIPGNIFNIVGVLIPTGSGSWVLKPRTAADLRQR